MTPPRRPWRRGLRKTLTCALVVIALQLSLLAVPELPAPVSELGTPAAAAQVAPLRLVQGVPSTCVDTPDFWSPRTGDPDYNTASECELELPACPEDPLQPGSQQFMRLSSPLPDTITRFPARNVAYPDIGLPRYSHFCELRVPDTDPLYTNCTSEDGFVRETYEDPPLSGLYHCRLLHPIACPAGLQLVATQTCRGIQRRTWECAQQDDVPLNEFNTCARRTTGTGSRDACNPAPASLTVELCELYVDDDFVDNASSVTCASTYATGTPVNDNRGNRAIATAPTVALSSVPIATLGMPANDYWCRYSTNWLRQECHGASSSSPSDCTQYVEALCLKRASGGGGCNSIAYTVRCRAYEAAYLEHRVTWMHWRPAHIDVVPADYVRSEGCEPCTALPFETIPRECPPESKWDAIPGSPQGSVVQRDGQWFRETLPESNDRANAHRNKTDAGECADPPSGRITWSPTHVSDRAVVNSAVIVTINDLGLQEIYGPNPTDTISRPSQYPDYKRSFSATESPITWKTSLSYTRFDNAVDAQWYIQTWKRPDASTSYADLDSAVGNSGCVARNGPTFRVIARELWPDHGPVFEDNNPDCGPTGIIVTGEAATILDLFGPDSLRWWCALTEQQRRLRTEARGIQWWHDTRMTSSDQDARNQALTDEEYCAFGIRTANDRFSDVIWCRWVPTRSGYFELHAASAWSMNTIVNMEPAGAYLTALLNYLNDPDPAIAASRQTAMNNRLRSAHLLSGTPPNTDWSLVGLYWDRGINVVSALPVPGGNPNDPNWVYHEDVMPTSMCPTVDLRVRCVVDHVEDYSTTPPVGVIVHEARVVTRAPS